MYLLIKKYIRYSVIIIFSLHSNLTFSQVEDQYKNLKFEDKTVLKESLTKNLEHDISTLEGTFKKEIAEAYRQRTEELIFQLDNGFFISDKQYTSHIYQIFDNIIQTNPDLQSTNAHLLISKYSWPNASCLGEGTIVINNGLINKLEHSGQIAFVLCHELAHYQLNHVNNAIASKVKIVNAQKTQSKLKKAKEGDFNRNNVLNEILKDIIYDGRSHSRKFEKEADSLGLIFLKKTKYNLNHAVRTLEILDSIDFKPKPQTLHLQHIFQSPDLPFKKEWLAEEESLSFGFGSSSVYDLNADSLKTHPDCKNRIAWLKQEIKHLEYNDDVNALENIYHDKFKQVKASSKLETISSEYFFENYANCLYLSLLALKKEPESIFLHSMIGKCMFQIYQAQARHELSMYVSLPSSEYSSEYNKVLNFIHKLRLSEIAQIGYYYMKKQPRSYLANEDFLYASILASRMMHKNDEIELLSENYLSHFSNGKYTSEIEQY